MHVYYELYPFDRHHDPIFLTFIIPFAVIPMGSFILSDPSAPPFNYLAVYLSVFLFPFFSDAKRIVIVKVFEEFDIICLLRSEEALGEHHLGGFIAVQGPQYGDSYATGAGVSKYPLLIPRGEVPLNSGLVFRLFTCLD